MSLSISAAAYLEKNKLASTGAWIVLLEITLPSPSTDVIRLARNNEDITWDGENWVGFPFEIDEIGESNKGEIPQVVVRVGNVTRVIQAYLEEAGGGIGAAIKVMVVHSGHLDLTTPEISLEYEAVASRYDNEWVAWTLGAENSYNRQFPKNRVLRNVCRFTFKDTRCGYIGAETICEHTHAACDSYGNADRFGGYIGVGSGGILL